MQTQWKEEFDTEDSLRDSYERTSRERPKSASYLRLKNIQGTTIGKTWKNFFSKKIFGKKVAYCQKTQKETL